MLYNMQLQFLYLYDRSFYDVPNIRGYADKQHISVLQRQSGEFLAENLI